MKNASLRRWKAVLNSVIIINATSFYRYYYQVICTFPAGVTFEVIEGGFLDIDIKITGPDNNVLHESEKESSGKYAFATVSTGIYRVCFNNERSSMTPKLVMFSIEVSETPHRAAGAPSEEEVGHTKLEDMIQQLSGTLTGVKHEQEYMHVRIDKLPRCIFYLKLFNFFFDRCVTKSIVPSTRAPIHA